MPVNFPQHCAGIICLKNHCAIRQPADWLFSLRDCVIAHILAQRENSRAVRTALNSECHWERKRIDFIISVC